MKSRLPHLVLSILLIGILSGFQKVLPNTEIKQKIRAFELTSLHQTDIVPVNYQNSKEIPSLFVQHEIKGNHVLIECIVTGISFRESDDSKQKIGKMVVWIDGEKNTEVAAAAFIIKGLSTGRHKVMLEVVNLNNQPYGLTKEFMVNIPR
jgi:hypothetical protein